MTFLFIRLYGREDSTNSECCSKTTTLPHHPNVSTSPRVVCGVLLWNRRKLIKVETFFFTLLLYASHAHISKITLFFIAITRQVWATNIPPKCLPIWHCVFVNPGGGQRLEACHHHQTGLVTLFFITSLLFTFDDTFVFLLNLFTLLDGATNILFYFVNVGRPVAVTDEFIGS